MKASVKPTPSVTAEEKPKAGKLRSLALGKVYGLLETGPVTLLTTTRKGKSDVMAQSWHTMMDFDPPLVGCVVSPQDFSYKALLKTRECVLAIPTVELAHEVVACGNSSGRDIDKFSAFGLTALPAKLVTPPLIAECYANLECKVVNTRLVKRYGFLVLEVVHAWIDRSRKDPRTLHHRGYGVFMVAGENIQLPSRMP